MDLIGLFCFHFCFGCLMEDTPPMRAYDMSMAWKKSLNGPMSRPLIGESGEELARY